MKTKILILSFSMSAMFTEISGILVAEMYQFIAILCVILLDTTLAMIKAYKSSTFETNKSFKAVIMLVLFWALLATVLIIEKGFPFVSFLSEAVIVPILLFQIISIIKNLSLLGYINNELAKKILSNIDNHKVN